MFEDDDNQYLDDEQSLDDSQEPDEGLIDSEEASPQQDEQPGRKGNLGKALQEERQRRKELEQKFNSLAEENRRAQAFMMQMQQRQAPQEQQDPSSVRDEFLARLLDQPDQVLAERDQYLMQQMQQRFTPMLTMAADSFASSHPEYGELYRIPEIKETVNAFVEQMVSSGQLSGLNDVQEVVGNALSSIGKMINAAGGAPSKAQQSGRTLSQIQNKAVNHNIGRTGKATQTSGDPMAILAQKQKLPDVKYLEWADSPEGQRTLSSIKLGGDS